MRDTGLRFDPVSHVVWRKTGDGWRRVEIERLSRAINYQPPDTNPLVLQSEAQDLAEWLIAEAKWKAEVLALRHALSVTDAVDPTVVAAVATLGYTYAAIGLTDLEKLGRVAQDLAQSIAESEVER